MLHKVTDDLTQRYMKLLCALFVLVFLHGCSKPQNVPSGKLENVINSFNEAYIIGDTAKLASMITENYVHTNSSWKSFGKEKWLSYMKARREKLDNGAIQVTEYKMEEYAAEQFENTAIVTALITSRGMENDTPFDKSFRVTNVWIYEKGNWRRAAFHDTPIK